MKRTALTILAMSGTLLLGGCWPYWEDGGGYYRDHGRHRDYDRGYERGRDNDQGYERRYDRREDDQGYRRNRDHGDRDD